jgi:hypothetical protein
MEGKFEFNTSCHPPPPRSAPTLCNRATPPPPPPRATNVASPLSTHHHRRHSGPPHTRHSVAFHLHTHRLQKKRAASMASGSAMCVDIVYLQPDNGICNRIQNMLCNNGVYDVAAPNALRLLLEKMRVAEYKGNSMQQHLLKYIHLIHVSNESLYTKQLITSATRKFPPHYSYNRNLLWLHYVVPSVLSGAIHL